MLENLTTNMMYSIRLQGLSESLYSPGEDIQGLLYVTLHVLRYMCYITFVTLHVLRYMCYITFVTLHVLRYMFYITWVTLDAIHYMCYII